MLQNPVWQATDTVARAQLAMFQALGEEVGLTPEDRRRVLDLDDRAWGDWMGFLAKGSLPAAPALPEMLCRLAMVSADLSMAAEGRRA